MRKPVSEDVCSLMSRGNMKNTCLTTRYFFPNKMNVYLNILGTLMLHRITREINDTNIVTIHQSCLRDRKMEFQKKIMNPTQLIDNISNTSIFDFIIRTREPKLSFGRSKDKFVTQKDTSSQMWSVWCLDIHPNQHQCRR